MKKIFSLLIIGLLTIMSFTACGSTNSDELNELRQHVEALETRISELEKNENSVEEPNFKEEITSDSSEIAEGSENSTEESNFAEETASNSTEIVESNENSNQQMLEYLDAQIESNNPANWLEIAKCDSATETHLLAVAKKCATLNYYTTIDSNKSKQIEIANALSENSATTDAVMKELVVSKYPEVWEVVACSNKSGEKALLDVAKKCATLNYYATIDSNKTKQIEITNALSENSATTDDIMKELVTSKYPEVWKAVACSSKSGEKTLLAVAKKCATLNYYATTHSNRKKQIEIANALSENSATTAAVMKELVVSTYPEVVSIAHKWIEQ